MTQDYTAIYLKDIDIGIEACVTTPNNGLGHYLALTMSDSPMTYIVLDSILCLDTFIKRLQKKQEELEEAIKNNIMEK